MGIHDAVEKFQSTSSNILSPFSTCNAAILHDDDRRYAIQAQDPGAQTSGAEVIGCSCCDRMAKEQASWEILRKMGITLGI